MRVGGLLVAIATLVATVVGDVSTAGRSPSAATVVGPNDRPNVVLFLLDDAAVQDMRYLRRTKRILGAEGMTFTNMIAPNPLCCPARAQILTAQVDHNNGVLTNRSAFGGASALKQPGNTIARWMAGLGYRNAFFGKHLNAYNPKVHGYPRGWDVWDAFLRGGTNYWHFASSTECPAARDACLDAMTEQKRYTTTVMRSKVLGQIDAYAGPGNPFFIFANWVAPHKDEKIGGERGVPKAEPKYADLYADHRNYAEKKPSFNEDDMSDKTADMRWEKKPGFRRLTQKMFLGRVRALRSVDDAIAATVTKLKETGEFDSTVFLFTSDNGFLNGEHRLRYKKWNFVEALRVPLIMSGPGVPAGTRTNRWVTMVDLAATILDATGARSRRSSMDGRSFLRVAPGNGHQPRPLLIGSGNETATSRRDHPWSYRGVMWGRYIWTKHWADGGRFLGTQFYDLATDPYQLRSRPNAGKYQGVIEKMKRIYQDLKRCSGSGCVLTPRDTPPPRS